MKYTPRDPSLWGDGGAKEAREWERMILFHLSHSLHKLRLAALRRGRRTYVKSALFQSSPPFLSVGPVSHRRLYYFSPRLFSFNTLPANALLASWKGIDLTERTLRPPTPPAHSSPFSPPPSVGPRRRLWVSLSSWMLLAALTAAFMAVSIQACGWAACSPAKCTLPSCSKRACE